MDAGSLSPAQRAVLEWMVAYPGVWVGWAPGHHATWTAAWADDSARQHMIGVMTYLGDPEVKHRAAPRNFPRGGTPRLTTQTFTALWRRGLVRAIRHRPATGVFSEMWYWQISLDGASTLNPALHLVRGALAIGEDSDGRR